MRDDLVDVELVEDDDLHGAPPRVPRRRWSARAWSRVAAVLAVVAVAGSVAGGRSAAEVARWDSSGLVADLASPWQEVWRADALGVVGAVGDVVVLTQTGGGILAVDLRDGSPRWSYEGGWCQVLAVPVEAMIVYSSAPVTDDDGRVVCQSADGSEVALLDPADGAVLRSLTAEDAGLAGLGVSWSVTGTSLVLLGRAGDAPTATAVSLTDGTTRWSTELPDADAVGLSALGHLVQVYTGQDGGPGSVLDVTTGWLVTDAPEAFVAEVTVDGLTLRQGANLAEQSVELVVERAGREVWRTEGYLYLPAVDDGSGDVVLVYPPAGGGVAVVDAATGGERWTLPEDFAPRVLLRGVLAGTSYAAGSWSAYRVSDGTELWRDEDSWAQAWDPPVADGRVLGGIGLDDDGWQQIILRDVHTGERTGVLATPLRSVSQVVALGRDRLLAVAGTTVVAMAP